MLTASGVGGVGGAAAELPSDDQEERCLPPTCHPPRAPADFRVTVVRDDSITLEWTYHVHGPDERNWLDRRQLPSGPWERIYDEAQPIDGSVLVADRQVSADTGYCYRVGAENPVSASSAETCLVATSTAPSAPSDLQAVARSDQEIALSWTDVAPNEHGSQLEFRYMDDPTGTIPIGPWQVAAVYGLGGTGPMSHLATGLPFATNFCFRLKAWNYHGSSYSNEACAKTFRESSPIIIPAVGPGGTAILVPPPQPPLCPQYPCGG